MSLVQDFPYSLGRLYCEDTRDLQYPFQLALPSAPVVLPNQKYWPVGSILNQGQTQTCVGQAWRQWLQTAPLMTTSGPLAAEIYSAAQKIDEWPGEEPTYYGTSVRAGAKAMSEKGHIETYLWASTPQDLFTWVLTKGPVVVGTMWYESMFTPLPSGVVTVQGRPRGGHAYLIAGYSRPADMYWCVNSWGRGWGLGGRFWIRGRDMHNLLFEVGNGEACTAVEKVLPQ